MNNDVVSKTTNPKSVSQQIISCYYYSHYNIFKPTHFIIYLKQPAF